MKCGHEGISAFVVTRGDPAEVFQAAEHALNGISAFVQDGTEAALPSTGRLERDVWRGATGFNQAADSISVIGLVREDDDILRQRRQEPSSLWRISGVPARQPESQWSTRSVAQRVDFGVPTASADADRLELRPPFPPAAERCAFTCVLSNKTSAGGPPAAASATNAFSQTPLSRQRTNRL